LSPGESCRPAGWYVDAVDESYGKAGCFQFGGLAAGPNHDRRAVGGVHIVEPPALIQQTIKNRGVFLAARSFQKKRVEPVHAARQHVGDDSLAGINAPCSSAASSAELTPLPETSATTALQQRSSTGITS
jgi:hypothetical protein